MNPSQIQALATLGQEFLANLLSEIDDSMLANRPHLAALVAGISEAISPGMHLNYRHLSTCF